MTGVYLAKHPRLMAAHAELDEVTARLDDDAAPLRRECDRARHAFDRRIDALTLALKAATSESHEALEDEAALDALLSARARLGVDEPLCRQAPAGNTIELAPLAEVEGAATGRWRLSTGAILQLNLRCGEFAGGGEGFLALGGAKPRVVRFGEGRVAELAGQLLVESARRSRQPRLRGALRVAGV